MSKRKFGFEGFSINRQPTYNFERSEAPQRLYAPAHDNHEDHDLDNIDYDAGDHPEGNPNPNPNPSDDTEEIDPLDAFMEGIQEEIRAPPPPNPAKKQTMDSKYDDDEDDDPMESFLKAKKDLGLTLASDALRAGYNSDEEVYAVAKAVDAGMLEYDSDDNPIVVDKRKIEPIAALDHSSIEYDAFCKDFYEEKPSVSGLSDQDVAEYRKSLAIRVSGFDVPKPVKAFEDCGFSTTLMSAISKQSYEKPTSIQCQALPIVLYGRDIIGIAKTGSGKTAAFVLPMIVHIMDQPELAKGEGPIGVICAATRELANQIFQEAKKFAKPHGIRVSAVYGGMSKLDQFKELKAGCEIVVATPGRLIDMLKMKALSMHRTTYLVFDEADRMFDLGFEPQIRSIVGQIRPDRQTLLFSATMPFKVERLARESLSDPIRVTVGEVGMANEDITQVVDVLPSDAEKMPWLLEKLPGMIDEGDVLVFASKKTAVDEIETQLIQKSFKVASLHGDKDRLLEKLPGMIDEGDVLVFASKKTTVDETETQLIQKRIGTDTILQLDCPNYAEELVDEPEAILDRRSLIKGSKLVSQVLIKWKQKSVLDSTWESYRDMVKCYWDLVKRFPTFDLEARSKIRGRDLSGTGVEQQLQLEADAAEQCIRTE